MGASTRRGATTCANVRAKASASSGLSRPRFFFSSFGSSLMRCNLSLARQGPARPAAIINRTISQPLAHLLPHVVAHVGAAGIGAVRSLAHAINLRDDVQRLLREAL